MNQCWVSLVLALPWVSIGHWNPRLHHLLFFDVPWPPIAMDFVRHPSRQNLVGPSFSSSVCILCNSWYISVIFTIQLFTGISFKRLLYRSINRSRRRKIGKARNEIKPKHPR
ncbi:hypothetical protein TorRG33x02_132280 [Trema orientale]|uniref:Transmembrane protein n=1 Tax=Trema orientale TaxID=63057 RepID=A0A2P5EZP4_TREOI|nr:hypothetical protein TorRG33x02_132280 [Trema orientale]